MDVFWISAALVFFAACFAAVAFFDRLREEK